jgi:hypothetical protein
VFAKVLARLTWAPDELHVVSLRQSAAQTDHEGLRFHLADESCRTTFTTSVGPKSACCDNATLNFSSGTCAAEALVRAPPRSWNTGRMFTFDERQLCRTEWR